MTTIGRVDFIVGLDGSTITRRAFVVGRQIGRDISRGIDSELTSQFRRLGGSIEKNLAIVGKSSGLVLGRNLADSLERSTGPRLKSFFMQMGDTIGRDLARRVTDLDFGNFGPAADDIGHLNIVVRELGGGFDRLAIAAGRALPDLTSDMLDLGTATDGTARSFDGFHRDIGNVRGAFAPLRLDLDAIGAGFGRFGDRLGGVGGRIRDAFGGDSRRNIGRFFRGFIDWSGEASRSTDGLLDRWKQIPHGARQFAFYAALFANLAESIAVLGSAAGAGLLTLGGALTFGGIGLATAIIGFTGLNKELDELGPNAREAKIGLKSIGETFKSVRADLQERMFAGIQESFFDLAATIAELSPAILTVGDSINAVMKDFTSAIAPGTKNFERLSTVIKNSGPIFQRILRVAGRFGEGLLAAFASPALLKSVNEMLDWLQDIADGFLAFTESDELGRWLGYATQVFGAVGRLLDGFGTMLNNLVDAEAVGRLTGFLDNITGFLPSLETMLSVLGEFDIFGLIAQGLNDFGKALEPLGEPMERLAGALNDVIQAGIDTLAPIFEDIATALAPVVDGIADFLESDPQAVADALLAIAGAALIIKGSQGLAGLGTVVANNLGTMATSVKDTDWKTIGTKFGKGGAAAFLPALVTGLMSGEGGAGMTIGSAALAGLSVGGLPGLIAGALIGSIVSAFTDPGSWENGAEQINTFFSESFAGLLSPESWTNGWQQIKDANATASAEIATQFEESWATWEGKFQNGRDQINEGVGTWWEGLMEQFRNGGEQIGQAWDTAWNWISTAAAAVWQLVSSGVGSWWGDLMASFANGASQITQGWNSFWGGLGGVLGAVWAGIVSTVRGYVNTIIGIINGMIDKINAGLSKIKELTGGVINLNIPNLPKTATGGVFWGSQARIIGEAGPEAVVPLNRPLSQVDPAVRGLSAFAQGKGYPVQQTGPQKVVNVEAGAIVVYEVADGRQTASAVLDRVVAAG